MKIVFSLLVFIFSFNFAFSQSLKGYVFDESNNPIPFATIVVKESQNTGGKTNLSGFYEFFIPQGQYEVMYSSIGFETKVIKVTINDDKTFSQTIYLKEKITSLTEVEVKKKRKNVGYEIVKNVIANKSNLLDPFDGFTCEIYVKETETFETKEKKSKEDDIESITDDILEKEKKEIEAKINGTNRFNLLESQITVNFQYPNSVKEEKTAQSKIGRAQQLYLKRSPIYPKLQFDFYSGLMKMEYLHETPIISPLHSSGILSYKYKLKEIITEGTDTIYKIKVSPRSVGTSSLEGYLYIKKHDWALTKVDVTLHKGNLKIYDDFRIIQEYTKYDSVWLVSKQRFEYKTKYFNETIFGTSEITYSDYVLNPDFPKKFFGAEVAATTKEAYERDTTYWNELRPIPLTPEEQRKKFVQDSLKAIYTSEKYLDSVQTEYNRITFLKVAWQGVGYMNREKKTRWYFSSLVDFVEIAGVGAPRAGPYVGYYKRFENQQFISTWLNSSIGLLNGDVRGNTGIYHLYNPKKLAQYYAYYSHGLGSVNWNSAYLDYLQLGNYFSTDNFTGRHTIEIINGLRLMTELSVQYRYPMQELKRVNIPFINNIVDKGEPYQFDPYTSTRGKVALSFTPFQKYVSEPYRKVVLGSVWPTFTVRYTKGIKNLFSSDVDFDKIEFGIWQELSIGTMGKTNIHGTAGSFLNQNNIEFVDKQFFRRSDTTIFRYLMSPPTSTFQNLKEAYVTENWYAKVHAIHHFNGAIINKVPFMKKTRIKSLAGAGLLYIPEYNNFFYHEFYVGIERNFKFARNIIRPSIFLVYSDSNQQKSNLRVKFLLDILDPRDMKFNF